MIDLSRLSVKDVRELMLRQLGVSILDDQFATLEEPTLGDLVHWKREK